MKDLILKTHGRRVGKALTQERKRLLDEKLPLFTLTLPKSEQTDPASFFPSAHTAYWMEIGFGDGDHILHQARLNPTVGILGCEPFVNGYAALFKKMHDSDDFRDNLKLWTASAVLLMDTLKDASLSRIDLLFPDPWPKSRHHKRRFVNPLMIPRLLRLLKPGGEFRVATDHAGYQEWIVEHMARFPDFKCVTHGPDATTPPQDWTPTRYYRKALKEGRIPHFWSFIKKI